LVIQGERERERESYTKRRKRIRDLSIQRESNTKSKNGIGRNTRKEGGKRQYKEREWDGESISPITRRRNRY
jgi:hypothetical protein